MGNLKKLHTDQGKEFYNRHVKELLQECGVHHYLHSECKKHKYQIGDKVRIASYRNVFRKSYWDTTFTHELFEIVDTLQTNPLLTN